MASFVIYEQSGPVVTLVLNNPDERNAIGSRAHCDEIVQALERANIDPVVKVVVLTGAGTAFCSGGHIRKLREKGEFARGVNPAATRENYRQGVQRLVGALWNLEVPSIAAVNGPAIGLGCDVACACDIRIAADSATFAESYLRAGLVPGGGGAWLLPRVVGFSKAAEMTFAGDVLSATEALACGLVSRIVPSDRLLAEARSLADRIAAHPSQALRLCKRLLRESQHARIDDLFELSAAFQALVQESDDHTEAVAALIARRPPNFKGS